MQNAGVTEHNIPGFQMIGKIIDTITDSAGLHIGDLNLRVPVPHKRAGVIFRKPLVAYQEREMFAAMLF